jgi:soluble lytic murein transglycosylase
MRIGRNWHAVRLLKRAFPEGPGGSEELALLFARAEAGWKNWSQVRALLEDRLESGASRGAEAWYLLGRALEAQGELEEAEGAFGEALESEEEQGSDGTGALAPGEARAWRALLRGRLGRYREALTDVELLGGEDPETADWVALEVAEVAAADGAREETREALSAVSRDEIRESAWDLLPRALLASGDSVGAEAAFWSSLPSLHDPSDQAMAWERVGALRMARGDSVGARSAYHQVLALSSAGGAGVRAAAALLTLGYDSASAALAGGRALGVAGRPREALEAYEVYETLIDGPLSPSDQLAVARRLLNVGQGGRALPSLTALGEGDDPETAAPALELKVLALRQVGRSGETRGVQDELMERFPKRPEALEIAFARAEALRNRGSLEEAIDGYRSTVAMESSHNLAGQARMWMGHLLLRLDRGEEALAVYSAYLEEFPDGRRADEAAYWRGRALMEEGLEEEGRDVLLQIPVDHPLSYYAVRAGQLLGMGHTPAIPVPTDTLPLPVLLREGLARFDRLLAVGLNRAADWEFENLADRIRRGSDVDRRRKALLRLAHELNERGFTREGINLGWELRREGAMEDRNLLLAIYPFPYRDIVMAEALERGIDPYLMAGLIRQESAFWVRARSGADARGLMQVLPATGRGLARTAGPEGFRPDDHLYEAEINIHLGMAFFQDMRRRFGPDLPIILSSYNAGPSRAQRWRQYPEARDMPLFVERIPFTETRGYVKNVLANRAIYAWLYGQVPDSQQRVPRG